jgi:hypothetical protein
VAEPTLSEIIDGALISDDSEIVPTAEEPVRAVDVLGPVAAVLRVTVGPDGDWYQQCSMAVRSEDRRWAESGSGGGHGSGWDTPWRPSEQTLDGRSIVIMGSTGSDLPDNRGSVGFVRAVHGFVHPQVRAIRVRTTASERVVDVTSPVGAFVVVVRGDDPVELQGLDETGGSVGAAAMTTAGPAARALRGGVRHRRKFGWKWGRP